MKASLPHWRRVIFVTAVFLVFLCNALGLIDFNFQSGAGIQLHWSIFEAGGGEFTLPPIARSAEFLVLFITGLVLCFVLPQLSPIRASLLTAAAALVPFYLGLTAPYRSALLPMEFSILTIGIVYGVNVLFAYFVETQSKHKIIGIFGQYIPPELVAEISRHPEQLAMESESRRLTVFFCDLQGFSSVAEQLNPRQLAVLLNEYFTAMTEVLFRHGATIDKYIGDCVMAFWGAPLPQVDHAQRAVLAAFDLHGAIRKLQQDNLRRGWPAPNVGIGINTGVMNVGNMGSRYRVAYTVVGDEVNLASRLETLTRSYGVPTLISESTRAECRGVLFRSLDFVQVKGKHNRTMIYQPVCREQEADDAARNRLALHEQAMELYFSENWDRARAALARLRDSDPDNRFYPAILRRIDDHLRGQDGQAQ